MRAKISSSLPARLLAPITLFFPLAVMLSAAPAPAENGGLTLHQVLQMRSVDEVALSPDGRQVAYVLQVPRKPLEGEENGPDHKELHVVESGGESRPFITGAVDVEDLSWLGDGRRIVFKTEREGDEAKALYVISTGGGEARKLLSHPTDVGDYSFSGDGRQVAFVAKAETPEKVTKQREMGFDQEIFEEDWRPTQLFIAQVEPAGEKRQVVLDASAKDVAWSPRGDVLAVKIAPTPLVDDGYMEARIWLVDAPSGEVLGKVSTPGKLGDFAWSPDGQHLAIVSAADRHDPREGRLMVVPAVGGEPRDLLPGLLGHVVDFAWRDAGRLWAVIHEGVESRLAEVVLESGAETTLVPHGQGILNELSTAQGAAALLVDTPKHPDEAYFFKEHGFKESGGEIERLTDSNPWLADVRLGFQDVVRYPARDGLEIEGLLIRPLDYQRGERVPMVMVVHGGPEAHQSNGWLTSYSRPGQVLAARGYAVFYPNYRGSTGRGVEFSKISQGDLAGAEFDDLVDGVEHLVEVGIADRDRVGITGGSYGGYASAWGATKLTEHFAASVMFVGISENLSKWGTSDIPEELYLVHSRKRPWENWLYFLERSPLYYVEQAKTPILILHGAEDPRVHPSQSMMFYRYLKTAADVPVRLVLYPGEKHGNRKAAAKLDYGLRMLRWMEHYLRGPGGEPPPYEIDYEKEPETVTLEPVETYKPTG